MFPVFDCVFYFPVSLSLFQRVPVPCNVVTLYFFQILFLAASTLSFQHGP